MANKPRYKAPRASGFTDEAARNLTYQLAMEADLLVVPDEWSTGGTVASAWSLVQVFGLVAAGAESAPHWCEHAASIVCEIAALCDDDPFFVYQSYVACISRGSCVARARSGTQLTLTLLHLRP